jgi:hypothetical protein
MSRKNGIDTDKIREGLSNAKGVKTNHAISRLMVYKEEIDAALQRGASIRKIHEILIEGGEDMPSLSNFYKTFERFKKLNPRIGTGIRVTTGGKTLSDSLRESVQ